MIFRARKLSAVVVDDEPDVCSLVELALREVGFNRVWLAQDGETAIDLVYRHQPDVVVLDVLMPGLNGEQVARALKKLSPGSLTLVFTAVLSDQPDWADGYLHKAHFEKLGQRAADLAALRRL